MKQKYQHHGLDSSSTHLYRIYIYSSSHHINNIYIAISCKRYTQVYHISYWTHEGKAMGPFPVSGCPFREPRVFEIAQYNHVCIRIYIYVCVCWYGHHFLSYTYIYTV
jgi:hypothetical protein